MTVALKRQKNVPVDVVIALGAGLIALACYVITLAPDVLYGDSAEFQALAYMLGITHTTGYPVYLLLAKFFGTIFPVGTFAYRVNLLSAIYAAGTVSGVYLLARSITHSRVGAVLGCLALGIAHSFWSQAVIAEVYTLATLVLTWSVYCLWRWQEDPPRKNVWLLVSILLLGLGVHTVVELVVPAVGIFILMTLGAKHLPARLWWRSIGAAAAGGAIGAAVFFLVFFVSDSVINPPTSFLNVTLVPSHSLWGASAADLDSFIKRLYHTVVPLQWGGALFSGDPVFMAKELGSYMGALIGIDFSVPMLLIGVLGLSVAFIRKPRFAGFMVIGFSSLLFYIINYKVNSKFVFYLATYVFLAVLMGVGAGFLLEKLRGLLAKTGSRPALWAGFGLAVLVAGLIFLSPSAGSRWEALQAGRATFYTNDEYTYPVKNLNEPRAVAEGYLKQFPDDAVLLMDWRTLYTTVYLANVEQNRTGITFREASPYPSPGELPASLVEDVNAFLSAGRPVFAESTYKNLRQNYQIKPVSGSKWVQLLPR